MVSDLPFFIVSVFPDPKKTSGRPDKLDIRMQIDWAIILNCWIWNSQHHLYRPTPE